MGDLISLTPDTNLVGPLCGALLLAHCISSSGDKYRAPLFRPVKTRTIAKVTRDEDGNFRQLNILIGPFGHIHRKRPVTLLPRANICTKSRAESGA